MNKMMQNEALAHLLKKEQLILAFPQDTAVFMDLLAHTLPDLEYIFCPLSPNELMGRIIASWEEGKVAVVDLKQTEAPSIFKNFLSDLLLYQKATPYPYGPEHHLAQHKIIVLADKTSHNALREYFPVVHE